MEKFSRTNLQGQFVEKSSYPGIVRSEQIHSPTNEKQTGEQIMFTMKQIVDSKLRCVKAKHRSSPIYPLEDFFIFSIRESQPEKNHKAKSTNFYFSIQHCSTDHAEHVSKIIK